mgnify:CR=1 FL=1
MDARKNRPSDGVNGDFRVSIKNRAAGGCGVQLEKFDRETFVRGPDAKPEMFAVGGYALLVGITAAVIVLPETRPFGGGFL